MSFIIEDVAGAERPIGNYSQIAKRLGLTRQAVSKLVSKGMPTTSLPEIQAWRVKYAPPRKNVLAAPQDFLARTFLSLPDTETTEERLDALEGFAYSLLQRATKSQNGKMMIMLLRDVLRVISAKEKLRDAQAQRGCIYCIKNSQGKFKVGRTTKDLRKRIASLQTANSDALHLVFYAQAEDISYAERQIHVYLQQYRIVGEWFDCEESIVRAAFIQGGADIIESAKQEAA